MNYKRLGLNHSNIDLLNFIIIRKKKLLFLLYIKHSLNFLKLIANIIPQYETKQ